MDEPTLSPQEALDALNELRSNMVSTQSASWSNMCYPIVAILNAAGMVQFDSTPEQMEQHAHCYGGAGGYPGRLQDHHQITGKPPWCKPVGELEFLKVAARRVVGEPSKRNLEVLSNVLGDKE